VQIYRLSPVYLIAIGAKLDRGHRRGPGPARMPERGCRTPYRTSRAESGRTRKQAAEAGERNRTHRPCDWLNGCRAPLVDGLSLSPIGHVEEGAAGT
jgi:hypothetical protein